MKTTATARKNCVLQIKYYKYLSTPLRFPECVRGKIKKLYPANGGILQIMTKNFKSIEKFENTLSEMEKFTSPFQRIAILVNHNVNDRDSKIVKKIYAKHNIGHSEIIFGAFLDA